MLVKLQLLYTHTPIFAIVNTYTDKAEQVSNNTVRKQTIPLKNGTSIVKRIQKSGIRKNQDTQLKKQCPEKNSDDGVVQKTKADMHTKCSTKYGRIIPCILKDLDRVQDVEEALRPWENKIDNKKKSIILKQQMKWDRALEIFNWFYQNSHELNVNHYNIMIRVLGRAHKWTLLEGLWNQMNARGIVATNSTYETLIDVYSKAGRREGALFWLETIRVQKNGVQKNQDTQLKKQCPEKNSDDGVLEKRKIGVHTKRSAKGVSYGGIIPFILKDLDMIQDVEEALRPWEIQINNKERSIILKQQMKWDRAIEIFNWFDENSHELNVIHYNIMIRIIGKARKWTVLEGLWNQMNARGIVATNSTYGTLIDVYSEAGLREDALFWFETMLEHGIEPDEVTMVTVVQLYKKAGGLQKAEEFFRKWSLGEPLRPNNHYMTDALELDERTLFFKASFGSHTYNTWVDAYGKAGQLKKSSETFVKMLKQGIPPTTVTFNTMIHICGNHGRLEEASSLLQKMEELQCSPNTRTYNTLISLHTKHNDIDMATKYFKRMKESCLEPDHVSYRKLLYAYSIRKMVCEAEELITEMDEKGLEIDQFTQSALTRMYIEAGMLQRSLLWFQKFHLAGNMTSECYAANIDAYGEHGHISEAEKVFLWCQERKNLSVLEFNVMIKAYGIGKCYDKACQLLDSMNTHGVVADTCSYSSLIQILATADQPHIAKPYLKKMQMAGLVTNCIPYRAVISSFVKLGQLEMAEGVYKEMIRHGVKPDDMVYGVLINALYDAGRVKEAVSYADEMKRAGLPGNTVISNSLIKLYTKVGYLKEAQETYKLLQSSEEGPAVYSSNCMIDLYTRQSMVDQAKEIFETLKKNGTANEFSFAMMLCLYKKIERFDEAIQIANQMRKLGLLTDSLSYNTVLDLYATAGRPKEAVETFKDMVTASIQLHDCGLRSLRNLLLRCGASRQALDKLQVLMKKDASHGLQAWMSALTSVLEIDDYDNK
ncbi:Pentatricopeptide repeat (PPR) superfamily protein [Trifolium repens]|nr:Pentatricopeptide repeat (PPR) superfamily protein [Trifolium repens]